MALTYGTYPYSADRPAVSSPAPDLNTSNVFRPRDGSRSRSPRRSVDTKDPLLKFGSLKKLFDVRGLSSCCAEEELAPEVGRNSEERELPAEGNVKNAERALSGTVKKFADAGGALSDSRSGCSGISSSGGGRWAFSRFLIRRLDERKRDMVVKGASVWLKSE